MGGIANGVLGLWLAAAGTPVVDATEVVTDLVVDMKYATSDNFLKQQVYPDGARCHRWAERSSSRVGSLEITRQTRPAVHGRRESGRGTGPAGPVLRYLS